MLKLAALQYEILQTIVRTAVVRRVFLVTHDTFIFYEYRPCNAQGTQPHILSEKGSTCALQRISVAHRKRRGCEDTRNTSYRLWLNVNAHATFVGLLLSVNKNALFCFVL